MKWINKFLYWLGFGKPNVAMSEKGIKFLNKLTNHRWDEKLISDILDNPLNARGFYKGNPQYYYNGYWVVLNEKCNRILKYVKLNNHDKQSN